MVKRSFEIDWKESKIERIIKNDMDQNGVKEFMRDLYPRLRETYKYLSGISPANGVPSIGQNVFSELVTQAKIADGKLMKLADIDVEFISTNAATASKRPEYRKLRPER